MTPPRQHRPTSLRLVGSSNPDTGATASADDRELDWSILMARAQAGDGAAYRRLLTEIMPYLRALAARRHAEPSDQEDAVQDILLTIHAIRQTYDPARPFGPWLTAIANRRLVDRLRRQGRRRQREAPLTEQHYDIAASQDHAGHADGRALGAALDSLPTGQRQAVQMLKLNEMSLKDAQAASGTSIASLKVTVHRAMKTLRKLLSDRSQP